MVTDSYTSLEAGCMKCLAYFGIFSYPLTASEIHLFNSVPSTPDQTNESLSALLQKGKVFKIQEYFSLSNDPGQVARREAGNQRAIELLEKSGKYVRIIARSPFVRGIAISGSLSKFYASPQADIDYFIITEANRLWIARTLLHLFKKLTFITGHQHYFCMNYFIDRNHLLITHPNLYSAIETVTVLPVYNAQLIGEFMAVNAWTRDHLPNYKIRMNREFLIKDRKYGWKNVMEKIIGRMAPDRLNRFLMRMTDRKWRRKWRHHGFTESAYNKAFQTETGISKNHPADFEQKVLHELSEFRHGA